MRQDITEQLIIEHEGLIFYTLDMLNCKHTDEAISVGYEALWRAIETFDETLEIRFSTYAVTCIRNAIWDMYRKNKEVLDHEIFIEDFDIGRCDPEIEPAELTKTQRYVRYAVDEALGKLKGKKLQIAKAFVESDVSATAIAKEVGCSQSYVSQVIGQVKYMIKQELYNAGYSPDFNGDTRNIE